MSERRCARTDCDWRPDPDSPETPLSQAMSHARASDHHLCITCTRSLRDEETRTCERCIGRAQKILREVVELYALLPEQIGYPATQVYDRPGGGSGTDGAPLPGGSALVLLGRGGSGAAARRLWPSELAQGLEQGIDGREHMEDNEDDDGTSVVHELTTWEDDWRHTLNEPTASDALHLADVSTDQWWLPGAIGPLTAKAARRIAVHRAVVGALAGPSLTQRTVLGAAGYLERRMRWAATEHEAFPEFLTGLNALRVQLQHATSKLDAPLRAPAPCLDCERKTIERRYRRPDPCDCERPPLDIPDGPEPRFIRLERHRAQLEAWEEAHSCDQGGLVEQWVCATCEREYTEQEYNLALSDWMQHLAAEQPDQWLRPVAVATMLQVTPKVVRHWMDRQQVTVCCDVVSHRHLIWWPDARAEAARIKAKRQRRRSA